MSGFDPSTGLTLDDPVDTSDHLNSDTHNLDVHMVDSSSNLDTIGDKGVQSVPDVIVSRLSDDSDSEGEEENATTSDPCTCVDNKSVSSISNLVVGRLSDDSDSDEESTGTPVTTCQSSRKQTSLDRNAPVSALILSDNSKPEGTEDDINISSKMCHSSKKESTLEQNTLTNSDDVKSIIQDDRCDNNSSKVPSELLCLECTDDVQTTVKTRVSTPGQSCQELKESEKCTSVEQKRLNAELFGDDDDSLSHLSLSDSSSCCSMSSLGSVDDLADLLRSGSSVQDEDFPEVQHGDQSGHNVMDPCTHGKETPIKCTSMRMEETDGARTELEVVESNEEEQMSILATIHEDHQDNIKPPSVLSRTDKEELLTGGRSTDFVAIEDSKAAYSHQEYINVIKEDNPCLLQTMAGKTAVPDMHTTTIGGGLRNGLIGEGKTVCGSQFVPHLRIEVVAAAADTASGEDSDCEVDISLSALFGDEFQAISPLPPSPFNFHISSLLMPISPLPPSPTKRQLLSPLPQIPHQEFDLISPLPPSPIIAHHSLLSPVSSPLPQTLNRAHCHVTSAGSESSGDGRRESDDASPVQFDDVAPVDVQIPKPCCLSISIQACSENSSNMVNPCVAGSTDTTPSPRNKKLRVSETSPFSPLTFVLPVSSEAVSVFGSSPVTPATEAVPVFEAVSLTKTLESATTSDCDTAVANSTANTIFNSLQSSPSSPLLAPTGGGPPLEAVSLGKATSSDISPTSAVASTVSCSSSSKQKQMPTDAVPDSVFEAEPLSKTAAISVASAPVAISATLMPKTSLSSPSKQTPETTESVPVFAAILLTKTLKSLPASSVDGCSESAIDPLLENNIDKVEEKEEMAKTTDVLLGGLKLAVKSDNQMDSTDTFEEPKKNEELDSYDKDESGETVMEASKVICTTSEHALQISEVERSKAFTTNEICTGVKLEKIVEAAATEFIRQVRELNQQSESVEPEKRVDSNSAGLECTEAELFDNPDGAGGDRDELGGEGVSLEYHGHPWSRVEEGEIDDIEDEDGDNVGKGSTAPLPEENDEEAAATEFVHQVKELDQVSEFVKPEKRVDSNGAGLACTEADLFDNPDGAGCDRDDVIELGGEGVSLLSLEHCGHSRSLVEEGEVGDSEEDGDNVGKSSTAPLSEEKEEEVAATKLVHQVRELDQESESVKPERRVDSNNARKLSSEGVSPLSVEHHGHSGSPVEEGEISDSEKEDGDKVSESSTAPPPEEKDEQRTAKCISDPEELIQLSHISRLQLRNIAKSNSFHNPISTLRKLLSTGTAPLSEEKEEEVAATKLVHQVRELDQESESVKPERRVDSNNARKLSSEGVSPLSVEHHGHSGSPVEEGEISDSEKEDGDKVGESSTAPPPEEKDKQRTAKCISDPEELIQRSDISRLQLRNIGKSNSFHNPISTLHKLLHVSTGTDTVFKSIPKSNMRSRQMNDTCNSAVTSSCTFDSLLNSFCSNTRGKKKGKSVNANQFHGSPNKPRPLARFPSAARSRNNKPKKSSGTCPPPRAADFVGMSFVANPPLTAFPCTITDNAQTNDYHGSSGGTGKLGKTFGEVTLVGDDHLPVPVSKRPKIEDALSADGHHRVPHLAGAMMGGDSSQPEATFPECLPGYMYRLRSRDVTKFLHIQRKRRTSSSSDGEQPTRKKRRNSNSLSGPHSKAEEDLKSNPVVVTGNDNFAEDNEGKLVGFRHPPSSMGSAPIEDSDAELCLKSSSQTLPSNNASNKEFPHRNDGGGDGQCMLKPFHQVTAEKLFHSNSTSSTATPQPITTADNGHLTSVLTDSYQLEGNNDSDQALTIADLDSLLDSEEISQASSPPPPQLRPTLASTSAKSRPHVRKMDCATGQEEDQTPASSPKSGTDVTSNNRLLTLSEQKGVQVTGGTSNLTLPHSSTSLPSQSMTQPWPLSAVEAAAKSIAAATCVNSSAVGYGQPQAAPLPEYTPPISSYTRSKCSSSSKSNPLPEYTPPISSYTRSKCSESKSNPLPEYTPPISSYTRSKCSSSSKSNPLPEYTPPISSYTHSKCSESKSDCQQSYSKITDVNDIFQTPLPLLGKSAKSTGIAKQKGLQNELSLAQRELAVCMQSPLPLPHWLVAAMTRVQSKHEHCAASGMGLSKKKRGNGICV